MPVETALRFFVRLRDIAVLFCNIKFFWGHKAIFYHKFLGNKTVD